MPFHNASSQYEKAGNTGFYRLSVLSDQTGMFQVLNNLLISFFHGEGYANTKKEIVEDSGVRINLPRRAGNTGLIFLGFVVRIQKLEIFEIMSKND